jgi:hypothetical protein
MAHYHRARLGARYRLDDRLLVRAVYRDWIHLVGKSRSRREPILREGNPMIREVS